MAKVFLGGTCNGSTHRDRLIPMLTVSYFNPIVDIWSTEAQLKEEVEKSIAKYSLYVITPLLKGVFSIAELIDDSNKKGANTIAVFLKNDDGVEFDAFEWSSLMAVKKMAQTNGTRIFCDLETVATFLNKE